MADSIRATTERSLREMEGTRLERKFVVEKDICVPDARRARSLLWRQLWMPEWTDAEDKNASGASRTGGCVSGV